MRRVPSVLRFTNAMVPELKGLQFSRENIYTGDRACCQCRPPRLARALGPSRQEELFDRPVGEFAAPEYPDS